MVVDTYYRLIFDLCDYHSFIFDLPQVDVLLTPVSCHSAPLFSDLSSGRFKREDEDDFYTQPVNLTGENTERARECGERGESSSLDYGILNSTVILFQVFRPSPFPLASALRVSRSAFS